MSLAVLGQEPVDPCFFSATPGESFASSGDISNVGVPSAGVDLIGYVDGDWTNSGGNNLNSAPPVECDVVLAAFLRPSGQGIEGLGIRLNNGLNVGANFNLDVTGISEGTGSDATFEIQVFTANAGDLYTGGTLQGNGPVDDISFGGEWGTQTINFTVPAASLGHNWIFLVATESSGAILNLCQEDIPQLDYTLPSSIDACAGETLVLGGPELQSAGVQWNTGANTPSINVTQNGIYSFTASNACNTINDATQVTFFDDPRLVPENDTTICLGTELELRTEGVNAQNLWSNGSTDSLWIVSEPGMYGVTVTDDCGNASYMIEVSLDSLPVFNLGNDTVLCPEEPLTLDAVIDDPDAEYLWFNGVDESTFEVELNTNAVYSVEVTNQCGTSSDAISVAYSLFPEDALAGSYELCFGVPLLLDVGFIQGTYSWRNGSTSPVFQVPSPGVYWVTIEDDDGCWTFTDTTVTTVVPCECPMFMPNAFSPNDDGINDTWAPVFECEPYDYTVKIIDRWGRILKEINDPALSWDGKIDGTPIRDGIYVYQLFYREVFDGIPVTKTGHVVVLQD